eukprot:9686887-Karenia_brevis.AAC.1
MNPSNCTRALGLEQHPSLRSGCRGRFDRWTEHAAVIYHASGNILYVEEAPCVDLFPLDDVASTGK